MVIYLFAAVAPVFLLLYYVVVEDSKREPLMTILKYFVVGSISVIISFFMELFLVKYFNYQDISNIYLLFINVFVTIGISEEGIKWLLVQLFSHKEKEYDQVYDIIVYSVALSLGFACTENILYVTRLGLATSIVRGLLSVPSHACNAILMGYFLGCAKLDKKKRKLFIFLSIIVPILNHTLYDYLILTMNISKYMIILFIIFIVTNYVLCFFLIESRSNITKSLKNSIN